VQILSEELTGWTSTKYFACAFLVLDFCVHWTISVTGWHVGRDKQAPSRLLAVTSWGFACTHAHTLGYERMWPFSMVKDWKSATTQTVLAHIGECSWSALKHIKVRSLVSQITTRRCARAFGCHLVLTHTHTHINTNTHTHTSNSHHWGVKTVAVRPLIQKRHSMYAHTLTRTHTHTLIHTHMRAHTHTYKHTHTHTQTRTHTQAVTVRIVAQERHGIACESVWICHAHARKCAHPQMYLHSHTMYIWKHCTHSKRYKHTGTYIYIHV